MKKINFSTTFLYLFYSIKNRILHYQIYYFQLILVFSLQKPASIFNYPTSHNFRFISDHILLIAPKLLVKLPVSELD